MFYWKNFCLTLVFLWQLRENINSLRFSFKKNLKEYSFFCFLLSMAFKSIFSLKETTKLIFNYKKVKRKMTQMQWLKTQQGKGAVAVGEI